MAGNIKGITIEIGGNTVGLNKALGEVNKETNKLKRELNDVEKLLKLDPTNTELLTQKQKLLGDSIGKTKDKLESLKLAQEQAQKQLASGEIGEEQYRKLQREITKTEQDLKKLEEQAKNTGNKMGQIADKVGKFGEATGNLGKKLLPISGTATAVAGGILTLGVNAGKTADDINTLSKQTGLTTEQIQKFKYASDIIDVSLETLTGSMAKLIRNMESARQGSKLQADAFKELGVAFKDDLTGELRNNQDVFNDCIDALGKIENETQRDAIAMQLFGKSAQDLNPLILGGSEALKNLGDEAEKAGIILSQDALDGANEFNDAIDELKATSIGTFQKLGTEIAKALIPAMKKLSDSVKKFLGWIGRLDDNVIKTTLSITLVVAVIAPLLILIGKIATGIQALIPIIGALWTIISAHPIGALLTVLGLAVGALIVFGQTAEKSATEIDGLVEANDKLETSTKNLQDTIANDKKLREENREAIETQIGASKLLMDELYKLADKEKLSNEEKAKMKMLVDQLNENIPDLNLLIDEETGKLSKQRDEVEKSIEVQEKMLKTKAAQKDMAIIAERMYEAEKNRNTAMKQNQAVIEKRNALEKERNDLMKIFNETSLNDNQVIRMNEIAIALEGLQDELTVTGDAFMTNKVALEELETEFQTASDYVNQNSTAVKDNAKANEELAVNADLVLQKQQMLSGQLPFNKEKFDELNVQIEANAAAMEKATTATEDLIIGNVNLGGTLEATGLTAEETATKYTAYADMTQDAFNKIQQNTKVSVDQMTANLNANADTVEKWAENIAKISTKGIDEGLLAKLKQAGPQANDSVATLVSATTDQINGLNSAFQRGGESAVDALLAEMGATRVKESGTKVSTDIGTGIIENKAPKTAAERMVFETKTAALNKITACKFETVGDRLTNDIVTGIKNGTNAVAQAVQELISKAYSVANGSGTVTKNADGTAKYKSTPMMANGGVLTRGTAIVGEAGPETISMMNGKAMVRPLMQSEKNMPQVESQRTVQSNNAILSALGELISAVKAGQTIEVDGYTFGRVVRTANAKNNAIVGV